MGKFSAVVASSGLVAGMLLVSPPLSATQNTQYAWMVPQPNKPSQPVTWNACKSLTYNYDAGFKSKVLKKHVDNAFAKTAKYSNIKFVKVSASRKANVKVSFKDLAHPTLGNGGFSYKYTIFPDNSLGSGTATRGWLRIDRDLLTKNSLLQQAVTLHEVGHVVGLGHVDDTNQLMYPITEDNLVSYAPGDIAGLKKLGLAAKKTCR